MSASPYTLNVIIHALLISGIGWLWIRWRLSDARQRASMAWVTVVLSATLPLLTTQLQEIRLPSYAENHSASDELSLLSWQPDLRWKIETSFNQESTQQLATKETFSEQTLTEPKAYTLDWGKVLTWTGWLWVTVSTVLVLRLAFHLLATLYWRRTLRYPSDHELTTIPQASEGEILLCSDKPCSACVTGIIKPVIVVPVTLFNQLTHVRWQWLLRHETEHIKGHDTRIALMLELVKAATWWNPFVHVLIDDWKQAREEVCDAAATHGDHKSPLSSTLPGTYANFLIELASDAGMTNAKALTMASSKPAKRLRSRIQAILNRRSVSSKLGAAFIGRSVIVLSTAVLIASCTGLNVEINEPITSPETSQTTEDNELYYRTFIIEFQKVRDETYRQMSAKVFLMRYGISFPEGSSAKFALGRSQLIVRNTPKNLDAIANLLHDEKAAQYLRSTQVYLIPKLVQIPSKAARPSQRQPEVSNWTNQQVLSDHELQLVVRHLTQQENSDVISLPSVTSRLNPNIPATIEAWKSLSSGSLPSEKDASLNEDFLGIQIKLAPAFSNEAAKIDINVKVGHINGQKYTDPYSHPQTDKKHDVRYLNVTKSITIPHTHTSIIKLGQTQPGIDLLLLLTARFIYADGNLANLEELKNAYTKQAYLAKVLDKAPDAKILDGTTQKPVKLTIRLIDKPWTNPGLLPAEYTFNSTTGEVTHTEHQDHQNSLKVNIEQNADALPTFIDDSIFTLSGVLTPEQHNGIESFYKNLPSAKVYDAVQTVSINANEVSQVIEGINCKIKPVIGLEGRTLDLEISINSLPHRILTTSVSIWNGQTICLSNRFGSNDAALKEHESQLLIMITASF